MNIAAITPRLAPIFLLMVAWFCFAPLAVAQTPGNIRGTVSDEKGRPVAGATVFATPAGSDPGVEKSVRTNNAGRFVIADLPWGKYTVTAEKNEAGYPQTPSAFYGGHGQAAVLQISPQRTTASAKIRFRGKVPAITGIVIDDEISVPISATFLFRHAKDPANVLAVESGANYRILLPARVDLTLEVSSPGHKTWYYPGTNDPAKRAPLQLSPGQLLTLNIRMDGELADCACLDRPQRWGLGPDSPAFQWHELQDKARGQACTPRPSPDQVPELAMAMQ